MGRQVYQVVSPNVDINENRRLGIEWVEKLGRTPHITTQEDRRWFWNDLDGEIDSESSWDYVNTRSEKLNASYPLDVTEWFMEFYRYMPEALYYKLDGAGPVDWNIFFSLAYPLPPNLYIPFHNMVEKLNIAQLRLARQKIKDDIWNDPSLRARVLNREVIPSIYTYYTPYHAIYKDILNRQTRLSATTIPK